MQTKRKNKNKEHVLTKTNIFRLKSVHTICLPFNLKQIRTFYLKIDTN